MDTYTTRPIDEVSKRVFNNLLEGKTVVVSAHALDHLSEGQRKVFKGQDLVRMVEKETPRKVYLQLNGRYSAYYRKSDGYRRLILDVEETQIVIVTFAATPELPRVRIENG